MESFQLIQNRIPRRAFLIMPLAFTGVVALSSKKETSVPDASLGGSGSEVKLAIYTDQGERKGIVRVRKIVKPDAEWLQQLSPEEFAVTRRKGTERPFTGRYAKNHDVGLYRCVCCGNALFGSEQKFESGTGWPSFWAPLAAENIYVKKDTILFMERSEVLCRKCDAHLGHMFDDGPAPTNLRYCMNSVSLRFIKQA